MYFICIVFILFLSFVNIFSSIYNIFMKLTFSFSDVSFAFFNSDLIRIFLMIIAWMSYF